jgi:hypothetical protein
MRRLLLVPALALVALTPSVAHAQTDPDELVVCDAPPANTIVIGPNETKSPPVEAPQWDPFVYTYTDVHFQLDLYPATATDTATVSSTLDWELDVNDWDLFLMDQDGGEVAASEQEQVGPLEAPAGESLSAELLHCTLFSMSIKNYQAIAMDDIDPLTLAVTTGGVETTSNWAALAQP